MNRRTLIAIAALIVGAAVLSNLTWLKRRQERAVMSDRLAEYKAEANNDRHVDIGVELRVVAADGTGRELIPGLPLLRVLRTHRLGGVLDTRSSPPRIIGPSRSPRVWYCSEDQEPVILHGDDLPLGLLVYGSEGAGKTAVMPKWHYCRWLEHLGEKREGGQTAPTRRRLKMFRDALVGDFPGDWYSYLSGEDCFVLADGTRLQLVSTHMQSKESGSPVQGYNWSWAGGDEFQDSFERADDVESRGRSARNGRYKQLRTCTPKDSTAWRMFKDKQIAARDSSGRALWALRKLLGPKSPFIPSEFWSAKKSIYTSREYSRRVDPLLDLPPELAVFFNWDRDRNLVARPRIATDITRHILSDYQSYVRPGSRFTLLAGHDPGVIFNTTVISKLLMFGRVPTWAVVGEFQTRQTTARQHAAGLRKYLRATFGVENDPCSVCGCEMTPRAPSCHRCKQPRRPSDGDKVAIFCDPHGKGEGDTDYQTVYGAMQAEGLDVFSPAHFIRRGPRIDMTNRLFGAADGTVRCVVCKDESGNTLAPVLVDALETLVKRPGDDSPEGVRKKNEDDKTHAPAALGYMLWPFEQEAVSAETLRRAAIAARAVG